MEKKLVHFLYFCEKKILKKKPEKKEVFEQDNDKITLATIENCLVDIVDYLDTKNYIFFLKWCFQNNFELRDIFCYYFLLA